MNTKRNWKQKQYCSFGYGEMMTFFGGAFRKQNTMDMYPNAMGAEIHI